MREPDPCPRAGGKPCPHPVVHGRYSTYANHGCRCDPCQGEMRAYMQARRRPPCWQVNEVCPHTDLEHGKIATYTNHRCRCDRCREVRMAYARELRARKRARLRRGDDSRVPHGTVEGFREWGCRCRVCHLAASRFWRARNLRYRKRPG